MGDDHLANLGHLWTKYGGPNQIGGRGGGGVHICGPQLGTKFGGYYLGTTFCWGTNLGGGGQFWAPNFGPTFGDHL